MRAICFLLFAAATTAYAADSEPYWETANQKFYALGGKTTAAEIAVRGGHELTADNIAQGRDLSAYDQGGSFDCRQWTVERRRRCSLVAIRTFLWNHWHQKRRGYVRITFDSVDAQSTNHIFVEPAADGSWHVAWRIARHTNEITDVPDITSVAWEPRTRIDLRGARVLVFRHSDHSEIERL